MEFQWWKWGSVTLLFKRNVKQFMKSLSLTVCCCCSVLLVVKRPLCYMHFLKSVSEATSVVFALKVGGEVTMVLTFRIYRRESLSCTGVMTSYILNVLESDYDKKEILKEISREPPRNCFKSWYRCLYVSWRKLMKDCISTSNRSVIYVRSDLCYLS